MDLQLSDKRALVTGSTSGIGEAIARELAAAGVAVVVQGRNEEHARQVVDDIARNGRAAIALGDLATAEGASRVIEQALGAFGGVDILVNNAGAFPMHDWWQTPAHLWSELYDQNVVSMVRMIEALVPPMKARGWGRVIQVASVVGMQPGATTPAYAATKAAVVNLTVSLAKELADTGVTVNAVSPGPIRTPGLKARFSRPAGEGAPDESWDAVEVRGREALHRPGAISRFGRPEEVAAAVVFLASTKSGYIHGTDLHVDGGSSGTLT